MAEIINLRTVRKRAARARADEQASRNRISSGVSKRDRQHAASERDSADRALDAHKRHPEDNESGQSS